MSNLNLPETAEDIVHKYCESLKPCSCDENRDGLCLCEFMASLWNFADPPMLRSDFFTLVASAKMSDREIEDFYQNYIRNWATEQTLEECIQIRKRKTSDRVQLYEKWREWQELKERTKRNAEMLLARD